MPIYLRQSTASQEIPLGYFVDSTSGDTEKTALTIANTDLKIWKTGATTLASKTSGGATHISNGIYYAVLDATDTNTLGSLVIFCHVATALSVRVECVVLAANVYDSLIGGGDLLDISTVQWTGTNVATPDTAGYPKITVKAGTGTGELDIASGVVKSNMVQILGTLLTETLGGYLAAGFKKFFDIAVPVSTVASLNQTGDSYARLGAPAGASVSADILDTLTRIGSFPGTGTNNIRGWMLALFRKDAALPGNIAGTFDPTTDSLEALQEQIAVIDDYVDTEIAAIKAKTDQLAFTVANQLDVNVLDWKGATAPAMTGDAFARLGAPVGASISADVAAVKTDTGNLLTKLLKYFQLALRKDAAIATDNATELTAINASGGSGAGAYVSTTDAQEALRDRGDAAWVTGATPLDAAGTRSALGLASANLDTQLDAIPTNSDLTLALGTADDAVLAAISSLPIPLNGTTLRSALGMAAANLDTQLDAIPTNSELTAALAAADDATLAAIAALPVPLTAAGVRTALGLASANLDTQLDAIPTNAELATSQAAADDATLAAIAALNNLSAAQVNAEMLDVLTVDTFAEPSAVPPATTTLEKKIAWMQMQLRNKIVEDGSGMHLRNDGDTADVAVSAGTDDGTTFGGGKWA